MSDTRRPLTARDFHARHQQLIDALQVIAPLAERLDLTARQQQEDATALLDATRRAVDATRPAENGGRS